MLLLSEPRGRQLARDLQHFADERLLQALHALAQCSPEDRPSPTALDEMLIVPFERAPLRLARDGYVELRDRRRPIQRPIRLLLLGRFGELRRLLLNRNVPASRAQRQSRLVNLIGITAGVMLPLLARERHYARLASLAGAAQRAIFHPAHADVVGAGADDGDEQLRYVLLAPVLWSVAASMPLERVSWADRRLLSLASSSRSPIRAPASIVHG